MNSPLAGLGYSFSRTTAQLASNNLLGGLQRTQRELQRLQNAISTGLEVTRPGDAPAKTAGILHLQQQLEARQQHERNLSHVSSVLGATDAALADVTDIVREARDIASSQIGIGSNADTRANQAVVIDGQLQAILDIVNRRVAGVGLFAGGRGGDLRGTAFADYLGGVRYLGGSDNLSNDTGYYGPLEFNSNGVEAFSALSGRVRSTVDLDPQATAGTRLADLTGGLGLGVRQGMLALTVDGQEMRVDLTTADTLGDVVTRVNAAIADIDPAAGALAVAGDGLTLTAAAGHTLSIEEVGPGTVARDLGIALSAGGAAAPGADLGVRLTLQTELAALGTPVDLAGGLTITQGQTTKVADFSSAQTVQDLVRVVQELDLGVRLEINDSADGLNLVSEVSGLMLSVSEAGGTTAGDLGLRTFSQSTRLADLHLGRGMHQVQGEDDFEVRLADGTRFAVNLDGAATIGDVIDRISAAAAGAGLAVGAVGDAGAEFRVGLAAAGNGLTLEDGTGGGGTFEVVNLGQSLAAGDLGIEGQGDAGGTIVGDDVAPVAVDSIFTHLMNLRDALAQDDSRGITVAAGALERHLNRLIRVRADVGVRAQRAEQQQERSAEQGIAEQTLLSGLRDADLTEVITRFQQLQLQLQASMQIGSANLQMSLLDFLR